MADGESVLTYTDCNGKNDQKPASDQTAGHILYLIYQFDTFTVKYTFKFFLERFHEDVCPSINVGEVRLIRLTLYYIPGPLPKVKEVVFLFGIFWGDACQLQNVIG